MFGENQHSDADEHNRRRKDDGVFELRQHLLAVRVFVHHALGDENGVVVALPEDEGGEDDVDDVEFHVENAHQAKDPDPRERERHKGGKGDFDASEREEQEGENDETADVQHVIEIA